LDFQFKSQTLKNLYAGQRSGKYPDAVITTFFEVTQIVKACRDTSFLKYFLYIQHEVQKHQGRDLHRFHLGEGFYLSAQPRQEEKQEYLEFISIKK